MSTPRAVKAVPKDIGEQGGERPTQTDVMEANDWRLFGIEQLAMWPVYR